MKLYEIAWKPQLPPRLPIIIRVDGRAFHSFTRGMQKPFDYGVMDAMDCASAAVAESLQGCILAYTQSDEASFVIQTDRKITSQMLWGGDLVKIVSTTAAAMTSHFSSVAGLEKSPQFDARAFVMPWDDVPNYILWRYRDWMKNSVTMAAQAFFSHKELHEKHTGMKLGMLQAAGHPWEALTPRIRHGRFWGCDLGDEAEANVVAGRAPLVYADIKRCVDALRVDEDSDVKP